MQTDASPYVTVLTAVGGAQEAKAIARALVERRLAACVQSVPIASCYAWNGKIHEDAEVLLLIKSRAALYPQIEAAIGELHSYATPEIVCLPIVAGARAYFDWIDEVTRAGSPPAEGSAQPG